MKITHFLVRLAIVFAFEHSYPIHACTAMDVNLSPTRTNTDEETCSLRKATLNDLDDFSCIDRIDSYKKDISLEATISNPLGVYILKENASGTLVGLQSFSPYI